LSNYKEAINQFKESLKLNEEIGNMSAMAINLGNLGTIYSILSDYTAAMNTLMQAYYINNKLGNQENMAKNLNNFRFSVPQSVRLSQGHRTFSKGISHQ
jgi:tetratricopeptide (TPR) repeat protein